MRLHVAFLPSLMAPGRAGWGQGQICLVVDVIRASTSLVTIVERGASRILIAGDVSAARQAAVSGSDSSSPSAAVVPAPHSSRMSSESAGSARGR